MIFLFWVGIPCWAIIGAHWKNYFVSFMSYFQQITSKIENHLCQKDLFSYISTFFHYKSLRCLVPIFCICFQSLCFRLINHIHSNPKYFIHLGLEFFGYSKTIENVAFQYRNSCFERLHQAIPRLCFDPDLNYFLVDSATISAK